MLHPNGASRKVCPVFLHGGLLAQAALDASGRFASFMRWAAKSNHLTKHPDLCRAEVLDLIAQILEKPVDVWRSIGIDHELSLRCLNCGTQFCLLFFGQLQRHGQPFDKLVGRWTFEAHFQRRDVALLITDALRKVCLTQPMANANVVEELRKRAHDDRRFWPGWLELAMRKNCFESKT